MPAFQNISMQERNDIVKFLLNVETPSNQPKDEHSNDGLALAKKDNDFPYNPPFIRGRGGKFKDRSGYPAIKPPWGTLNAIDLNTGAYLWTVPLGEYPELTKKGVPITGTENTSGPMVTAGGLLFIAGTEDEKFRAFDAKTGKVVWEYQLPPGGAFASPSTYMINGKQYIVLAAGGVRGGHKPGGNYIAFKLP
jgi:quinoprotein glucose dehydrogenase